jgi:hypothetical protein
MNPSLKNRILTFTFLHVVFLVFFDIHYLSAENLSKSVKEDWLTQYDELKKKISTSHSLAKRTAEDVLIADKNALVLPTDRDPVDIVVRRTQAVIDHINQMRNAPDLSSLQRRLNDITSHVPSSLAKSAANNTDIYLEARSLQREAVLSNPLLNFDQLLFIERGVLATGYHDEYNGDHCCDQYYGHNGKAGGGLYILKNPFSGSPQKINILQNATVQSGLMAGKSLNGGSFCSPDLSFDGKRIAFAWSPGGGDKFAKQNRFRIFVVNVDGTNLVQLTGDVNEDDLDPCWLPGDKRIIFISSQRGGYGRCHGRPVPTYTMYSMDNNGSDLYCIDWHETNEFQPSINNAGNIVYTRWDYVDRDAVIAHHFWMCGPDGTDPRSWHGNYPLPFNTIDPVIGQTGLALRTMSEFNYLSIPGSPTKYVTITGPHHGQSFGDIAVVDIGVPDDGKASQITKITEGPIHRDDTGEYGTAWPLSEDFFICNYRTGLYLIDKFGNRELLYTCETNQPANLNTLPSLFRPIDPIPVRAKKLSDGSNYPELAIKTFQGKRSTSADHKPATLMVVDAKISDLPTTDTPIKWMRIVQLLPKATPNANNPATSYGTQSLARMPLGVVPVESDGSVFCEAPVGKLIYFQLLDEKGMAVRTMRSATYVHPGEQLSCTGCHENKWEVTPSNRTPIALSRPFSRIAPEVIDGAIPYNWHRLVAPVLNTKCAPCHKQEGKGPDMSFASLKDYAFSFHGDQGNFSNRNVGGSRSLPGKFGARLASLTSHLDSTHYGVQLTDEERRRITLWLDLNSNELGAYTKIAEQRLGMVVWPEFDVDPLNPLGVEDPRTDGKAVLVKITPDFAIVKPGKSFQFTATATDSLNRAVLDQPSFSWSVSGGGSVNQTSGLFTANNDEGGPYTMTINTTINGAQKEFSSKVVVSTLNGLPLSGGNLNRILCLKSNEGSTCIGASDTAAITNLYVGTEKSLPIEGASSQINAKTYTWTDEISSNGIWFAGCGENVSSYGSLYIANFQSRQVKFAYIQDDELTVWMNGEKLFDDKNYSTTEKLSPSFTLPRGNVNFLFKWSNAGGAGSLSLRLADDNGDVLNDLLFYTNVAQTQTGPAVELKPLADPYSIRSTSGFIHIAGTCNGRHQIEIFSARGQRFAAIKGYGNLNYNFPKQQWSDGLVIVRMILDGKVYSRALTTITR